MAVNYQDQYRPDQLEPFWPNEIAKMAVVVLCTLSLIMLLAILPILLDMLGIAGAVHEQSPANPHGATPAGIKPEWYFLAVYQYLKLMPTEILGISGKTVGVLSQMPVMLLLIFLPFWYRRRANRRPGMIYRTVITVAIVAFLALTLWGGWPEHYVNGEEQLIPLSRYVELHPMRFIFIGLTLVVFYFMISHERRAIRRILKDPPPADSHFTEPSAQAGESS